jgi:hypothetical protein
VAALPAHNTLGFLFVNLVLLHTGGAVRACRTFCRSRACVSAQDPYVRLNKLSLTISSLSKEKKGVAFPQ